MSNWNPNDPIYAEWAATLRERIAARQVDPTLVSSWLAMECSIVRGTKLLD